MAEYLIQDTTLTAIADAIRSKTGTTDTIPVTDMANQITSITTGGGGDYTVTFMNYNGTEVLYEKQVMEHDTCADPVELGLINTPTRESTAQFTYSFEGWYSTANHFGPTGDEDILKNITSDVTVYAVMVATIREYMVSFYDGDTLLKQIWYEYGATPSYTPEKDGYEFIGWDKELAPVTGDAEYYAQWNDDVVVASGSAGDNVTYTLTSSGTLTFSGSGAMKDYSNFAGPFVPWKKYASTVKRVVFDGDITHIGASSFEGCTALISIVMPDTIVSVGHSVFNKCTSLVECVLSNNLTETQNNMFRDCSALREIIIPDSVTYIKGSQLFYGCASLKRMVIGSNVTKTDQLFGYTASNNPLISAVFKDPNGWFYTDYGGKNPVYVSAEDLADETKAAEYLRINKYWAKE